MGAGTQRIRVHGWGPRTLGKSALFALILVGVAVGGSAAVIAVPELALALPVLVVSTVLALRYPAAMTVTTFFFTGTLNLMTAYTPLPVGPLVDVLLAGLVFSVLYRWITGRVRPGRMIWAPLVPLAIYVVFTLAQTTLSDGLWFAIQGFRASTWYVVAFFVIAGAGWSRETYERIARGIVVVALFVGAYAAVRWVIGPGSAERELAVSQAKDYNFVDGELRLFGSFTSGGELAAWVAPAICVCAFYAIAVAGRWRRLAIAACVLCTIGLLGSENRTGLVAIVLGLTVCFVVFQVSRGLQSSRLTASLGLLVGVLLVGGSVFMFTIAGSPGSVDRYKGIFHPEREQSVKHRQEKWDAVLPQIDQEALGHGIGTAGRTQKREGRFINLGTNDVNSGYFRVGFEQGPWAMWFYAFALIVVLGGLIFWAATTPSRLPAALATGAAGAFVAFAMLLASESAFSEGLGTLAVWMLLGTAVGAVRQAGTR